MGAMSKGKIKPQWSAWVLAIAPMARVEVPQEVEKGYCVWLSLFWNLTCIKRQKLSPK